jgi:hypothetical protein
MEGYVGGVVLSDWGYILFSDKHGFLSSTETCWHGNFVLGCKLLLVVRLTEM